VVGLDLGTTRAKGRVYAADGTLVVEAASNYPTVYPRSGWAEQTPEDWTQSIRACLGRLVASLESDAERIGGIGLSAHAPSLVPVDADGEPVLPRVPIWQDERSAEQARQLLQEIGPEWVGLGMPFAAFAAKLKWFIETHPDRSRATRFALGTKAYLARWLTGSGATDPSSEPGNGDEWSEICRACGWSRQRLPPRMAPTDVVGSLRAEIAAELGLVRPVPVVLGLNDGGSSVLGSGAIKAGTGVVSLGTNGVIFVVADKPVGAEVRLSRAIFCWPYLEDRWIVGGQTKTGGASLGWLYGLLQTVADNPQAFDENLAEAEDVSPGADGVTFVPYLMGAGTPRDQPSATAAFAGLTLTANRAHLARAVLEGVAYSLRDVFEELRRLGIPVDQLTITGGGAESGLWRRIVADVLDMPLGHGRGDSCLGAAIMASVGVGIHPDIASACAAMCPRSEIQHPTPDADVYRSLYRDFGAIRDMILQISA
jgi:xylulokinase